MGVLGLEPKALQQVMNQRVYQFHHTPAWRNARQPYLYHWRRLNGNAVNWANLLMSHLFYDHYDRQGDGVWMIIHRNLLMA